MWQYVKMELNNRGTVKEIYDFHCEPYTIHCHNIQECEDGNSFESKHYSDVCSNYTLTLPDKMGGVSIEHEVGGEVGEAVEPLATLVPQTDVAHQLCGPGSGLNPHLTAAGRGGGGVGH